MTILFLFVVLFLLMFIGVPIAISLGLAGSLTIMFFSEDSVRSLAIKLFETSEHYTLLAIPFFLLAGAFMTTGGVARRLIDFANACVGHIRGGLAIGAVLACMLFAALSGSSPATVAAVGYDGPGDFRMTPSGRLLRRPEREIAPFAYTGVQLVHPRLFEGAPEGAFSFNLLWDQAIERERLYGVRHDGTWYHVGTPEALEMAQEELAYDLGESEAWAHNVKAYYDPARSS